MRNSMWQDSFNPISEQSIHLISDSKMAYECPIFLNSHDVG